MISVGRDWFALEITPAGEKVDDIADFCRDRGSDGVLAQESHTGISTVTAYFREDGWEALQPELERLTAHLHKSAAEPPAVSVRRLRTRDENWTVLWKNDFAALPVGDTFMVTAPWVAPDPGDRTILVIEPSEAFGTGLHETTRCCLELLAELSRRFGHSGFTMLDAGCGTGILGISGAKLGATRVLGVDKIAASVTCAVTNASLNGVSAVTRFECRSLLETGGRWDVVAANLDPLTLKAGADRLIALCDRFLVLSGVMSEHWSATRALFEDKGMALLQETASSKWACGLFSAKGQPR